MFIIDADERKQMYMNWNEKDKQSEKIKMVLNLRGKFEACFPMS